jgi:3-methylcrotonyl-CoA carboxylase alpha subunit
LVHLFERDCSLQRRHQKVIEEAPAPGMPAEMRAAMGGAAVEAARAVGYVGAGTVEFIADAREGLRPDRFYFMEMNTRLQVEHPVTEAITGVDLVEWQLRVASGEKLPLAQDDLAIDGHAVEARLYAEDPERDFLPSTGRLWALEFPEDEAIRIDSGVEAGDDVTPYYDPMIAKIIAHGSDRSQALGRLAQALDRTLVAGPKSNVAFLKALCEAEGFRTGSFDTGFIERHLESLGAVPREPDPGAVAAGALYLLDRARKGLRIDTESPTRIPGPWDQGDSFQLLGRRVTGLPVVVEGSPRNVQVRWDAEGPSVDGAAMFETDQHFVVVGADDDVIVLGDGRQTRISLQDVTAVDLDHLDEGGSVRSPMHGKLISVFVAAGDRVTKGQRLAIVEAMKMEHVLVAPSDAEVVEVAAVPGAQVAEGARLIVLKGEA